MRPVLSLFLGPILATFLSRLYPCRINDRQKLHIYILCLSNVNHRVTLKSQVFNIITQSNKILNQFQKHQTPQSISKLKNMLQNKL